MGQRAPLEERGSPPFLPYITGDTIGMEERALLRKVEFNPNPKSNQYLKLYEFIWGCFGVAFMVLNHLKE